MNFKTIKLPDPMYESTTSLESAMAKRRSVRKYKYHSLCLSDIAQILWAAQGITDPVNRYRSAPSAGALYPLELYILIGEVENIEKGIYKYNPYNHEIIQTGNHDIRDEIYRAALYQECILNASMVIIISAVYGRTIDKYHERGKRYVDMEVGNVSQNIHLQVLSLNLGTVVVGAFNDERIRRILDMPENEWPLCIMPIGKPA